jgi:hypothetical protein
MLPLRGHQLGVNLHYTNSVNLPVRTVNKDLRPVSLTPIVSKLAEEVVVEQFIKLAILKVVDPNQYGTVPKSSTTQALISIVHNVAKATDGNGALVS